MVNSNDKPEDVAADEAAADPSGDAAAGAAPDAAPDTASHAAAGGTPNGHSSAGAAAGAVPGAAAADRPIVVRERTDARRYVVNLGGETAFLQYERTLNTIALVHTEVPVAFRGRGVASALTRFALEAARADELVVVPRCPFVQAYIRRHPEFAALLHERAAPS